MPRPIAAIVKFMRHAIEWKADLEAARATTTPTPYDHGTLPSESYTYWMTRLERERRNGRTSDDIST